MPQYESSYPISRRGRATSFTESEVPPEFCLEMKNRFINAAGGAEKRQGMNRLGNDVPGLPNLTGIHSLVEGDGNEIIFVSGNGRIWRFDDPDYTEVYSDFDTSAKIRSVQMEERTIFYNGINRNIFTKDGSTFEELQAIIERGEADAGTNATTLVESDIENWVTDTNTAINDLVRNRTKNAVGIINAVNTANVTHTTIGPGSASAIGVATANSTDGDRYEVIDLVELNVIPTDGDPDNVAVLASGSSENVITVSAVSDWTDTEIKLGDYIRNTTRSAVAEVTNVSAAAIHVTGVSAQVAGDSILLFKSAMPIASYMHVHFGRNYMVDSRDRRLVRITGPNNPENVTTDAGTLDSSTFKFGSIQPQGDEVRAISSFQRFLVLAGRKNTYFYQGTDPIADEEGDVVDFDIIGLFPQGIVSADALTSIGNDMIWATPDGVQSASLVEDASNLGRANLSEAIKKTLREDFTNTPEDQIVAIHYPRRSWYLLKVGSQLNVFNYTAFLGRDQLSSVASGTLSTQAGSWSLFDGKLARQNAFFVCNQQCGLLLTAGPGGQVFRVDQGDYDDDGEQYSTVYKTGWLTLEPNERRTVFTKQGNYIKPIFETGSVINYNILVEAGFDSESTDSITVPSSSFATPIGLATVGVSRIGGSSTKNPKFPLRWRGEQCRVTVTTDDDQGPDTISRFTLYATKWGRR